MINLLVQASSDIGLGHLMRSAAVTRELVREGANVHFTLLADEFGCNAARRCGIPYSLALPPNKGIAIVDAVEIGAAEANWLSPHSLRLVISPVFNRFDMATHVLVRHLPDKFRASIPDYAELLEDDSYAFVTSNSIQPSPTCYSKLRLGVCLGGGEDYLDLEELLENLATVPNMKEIRLIANQKPRFSNHGNVELAYSGFVNEPWDFLQPINLFLGGEGLLIAESVARGLPTISLLSNPEIDKNRKLVEAGAVMSFPRNPLDLNAVSNLLTDTPALSAMNREAINIASSQKHNALPQKILEICASSWSN